jgi:hypothetical protein
MLDPKVTVILSKLPQTVSADMGCKLDPEYIPYKRFLLTTMRHDSVSSQAALPEVTASDSQVSFRCSIACHVGAS